MLDSRDECIVVFFPITFINLTNFNDRICLPLSAYRHKVNVLQSNILLLIARQTVATAVTIVFENRILYALVWDSVCVCYL